MRLLFGFLALSLITVKSFAAFEVVGDLSQTLNVDLASQIAPSITLTLKNAGSSVDSVSSLLTGADKFSISLNRCSNVALGKSCQISITPKRGLAIGDHSFSVANVSRNLSILDSRLGESEQLSSVIVSSPSSFSLDFTDNARSKVISLSLKNNSKVPASLSFSWGPSDQLGAVLVLNRCSAQLGAYKSCVISYKINLPAQGTNLTQNLVVNDGAIEKASIPLNVYRPGLAGLTQPPLVNFDISPYSLHNTYTQIIYDFFVGTGSGDTVGSAMAVELFGTDYQIQQYQPSEGDAYIKYTVGSGPAITSGPIFDLLNSYNAPGATPYQMTISATDYSNLMLRVGSTLKLDHVPFKKDRFAYTSSGKLITIGSFDTTFFNAANYKVRLYSSNDTVSEFSVPGSSGADSCAVFQSGSTDLGSPLSVQFKNKNGKMLVQYRCYNADYSVDNKRIGVISDSGIVSGAFPAGAFPNVISMEFNSDASYVVFIVYNADANPSTYEIWRMNAATGSTNMIYQSLNALGLSAVMGDNFYIAEGSVIKKININSNTMSDIYDLADHPELNHSFFNAGALKSTSTGIVFNSGAESLRVFSISPADVVISAESSLADTIRSYYTEDVVLLGRVSGSNSEVLIYNIGSNTVYSVDIASGQPEPLELKSLGDNNNSDDLYQFEGNIMYGLYANADETDVGFAKIDLMQGTFEKKQVSPLSKASGFVSYVKNGKGHIIDTAPQSYVIGGIVPLDFYSFIMRSIDLNQVGATVQIDANLQTQLAGSQTLMIGSGKPSYAAGSWHLFTVIYNLQVGAEAPVNQTDIYFRMYKH